MLNNHEILPKTGLGELTFGIVMDDFIAKYGEPE
jgi:hypothetical protein